MVCPVCKNLNARPVGGINVKIDLHSVQGLRNYICDDCGYSFITMASYSNYTIIKKKGARKNGSR